MGAGDSYQICYDFPFFEPTTPGKEFTPGENAEGIKR